MGYLDPAWIEAELDNVALDEAAIRTRLNAIDDAATGYETVQIGQVKKSRGEWLQTLHRWLKELHEYKKWLVEQYRMIPQETEDYFDLTRLSRADDGVVYGR